MEGRISKIRPSEISNVHCSVTRIRSDNESSSHDMNGQNATLMTRQQVIDEITDDRVGFVAELCHNSTYERGAAGMPLQINRAVKISSAVYLRPAMRTARLFVPDFDETEFFLQLRIAHDFVP